MQRFVSPLSGLFIFSLASGYLMSLIPLRLGGDDKDILSGFMGSVYYFGLLVGSFRSERMVVRIGHIRSFSVFMALLCSSVLSLAIFDSTFSWLVCRFINGIAVAGIFVVVESWLLCESDQSNRGRILAFYMITLYGANALGQLFVQFIDSSSLMPFILIGAIFSLSILPPSLTRLPTPEIQEESGLNIIALFRQSPSAVVGCITGGMIMGALYSLLPLMLLEDSNRAYSVATLLAVTMTGGMLLQYPIGRLSDYIDRRKVMAGVSFFGAFCCFFYVWFAGAPWMSAVLLFLAGGAMFTLYPLAISHGVDHMQPGDIVAGTQGLLLGYSAGACVGPIIAAFCMNQIINYGLMIFFIIIMGATGLFFLLRIPYRPIIFTGESTAFIAIPRTTPVTAHIDPRGDAEGLVNFKNRRVNHSSLANKLLR